MNKQQLLLQERFSEKIKFSEEYLNKYGRDWYQGLTPSPIAIFFPENEEDVTDIIDFASKNKLKIVTKKKPSIKQLDDLKFAFNICKFVKSNACHRIINCHWFKNK